MTDHSRRNRTTRAIITGGAQGLGYAIAERLADEGAPALVLAGRDAAKGEAAARRLQERGPECLFVAADLGQPDDCARLVATALDRFGTINGLVNAAASTARGSILDTPVALFDAHMAVNARGPFLLIQGVARHLVETGQPGSIVNILSMALHCGQSFLAPYSASKAALANITKNAANALVKKRIRCNAILPGWMDTPGEDETQRRYHGATDGWLARAEAAQPMGMLIKPAQVAGLAAFLLSPESGVMTGALIDFDQTVSGAHPE